MVHFCLRGMKRKRVVEMTKSELMLYVNKNVRIYFKDGENVCGTLGYADEFSERHNYRKPDYFYIGDISFRVSHVRKVTERGV